MQATYKIVDFGISKMFKNTDNGNAESAMVLIDPALVLIQMIILHFIMSVLQSQPKIAHLTINVIIRECI
ncbi:hypothetical protein MtrunA17_Chr6g0487811 [Medicago truncatula]|uniref:Protein kinase domain-containing protein n=1 Tax=Medicago truncatula TaxID=3880 RepID=A0A396HIE2_MEDTR|nr:hypothetical protein MtrunA17_Chr6g0487811 [Medicago truncatula]